MGYNQLTALPDSIGNLSLLKSLWIINNNISSLPESINKLKKLKYIGLMGTKITQVPKFLKDWRFDEFTMTISPNGQKI